jgi:hypothetical protein
MLTSKRSFHLVDPSLTSYELLHSFEIERVVDNLKRDNIKLYGIPVTNWNCVALGAQIGDIICMKNHIANIYRKVVE